MCDDIFLEIPNSHIRISQGSKIKLGRFEKVTWIVRYGWYSYGGNRPVCGWYLVNSQDPAELKPISLPDLTDIYFVEN